ncbi:MAG: RNA polymerase sigma factor [Nannocystaceae bacterium]|nr:RNA polymerase sigma factor [bacterium]
MGCSISTESLLVEHLDSTSCPPAFRDEYRQETAVRILTRLRSDSPPTISRAYVRRAARTVAIDRCRREGRRRALLDANTNAAQWNRAPRDPEMQTHARQVGQIVREELARLPEQRQELLLRFIAGHGISELANELGLDRKRVDNWVYRALATLRRRLSERGLTQQSVLGA